MGKRMSLFLVLVIVLSLSAVVGAQSLYRYDFAGEDFYLASMSADQTEPPAGAKGVWLDYMHRLDDELEMYLMHVRALGRDNMVSFANVYPAGPTLWGHPHAMIYFTGMQRLNMKAIRQVFTPGFVEPLEDTPLLGGYHRLYILGSFTAGVNFTSPYHVLALMWRPSTKELILASHINVFSSRSDVNSEVVRRQKGHLYSYSILLGELELDQTTQYEVVLEWDPPSGVVGVLLTEVATGQTLVQQAVKIDPLPAIIEIEGTEVATGFLTPLWGVVDDFLLPWDDIERDGVKGANVPYTLFEVEILGAFDLIAPLVP